MCCIKTTRVPSSLKRMAKKQHKTTKYISILYFFVTDRIERKGEVTVEYFPTDEIIAYYFRKLLQGSKFQQSPLLVKDRKLHTQEPFIQKNGDRNISM